MEPVSNLGRYGRGLIITVGIILILVGLGLIAVQHGSHDGRECLAEIIEINHVDGAPRSAENNNTVTVLFEADGKPVTATLGQFEASWEVGDTILIQYDPSDPTKVQTRTMTYLGWVVLIASLPFLSIGIFMTLSVRRRAAKTPEEIAEDEERTTAGKLKYKVSSIVIPLCAGIPVWAIGIVFFYLEHNSVLGTLAAILGCICIIAGLRSVVYYVIIKYRRKHTPDDSCLPEVSISELTDNLIDDEDEEE